MAKALNWNAPDGEGRKPGEQRGLDTPVVLAVNDADWEMVSAGTEERRRANGNGHIPDQGNDLLPFAPNASDISGYCPEL